MNAPTPSIHASCVLVGSRGVLIRGPSGAGKSRLALRLIQAAERDEIPFARLVSDDRTLLSASHGRLLARPAPQLAGMIEIRGSGIQRVAHEAVAVLGLVVDLATAGDRLPDQSSIDLDGVKLPYLAVPQEADPLPLVLAALARAA
jgi:serine kinase of HPr protein (carbohydrate metabolism regulator)